MNDHEKDYEQVLKIYGDLCDVQSRFSCALQNAHFLFGWYAECSKTIVNSEELNALYSVFDQMSFLNQLFDDFTSDMGYYLHEKQQEGEAWEKAEKANQQREGYAPAE